MNMNTDSQFLPLALNVALRGPPWPSKALLRVLTLLSVHFELLHQMIFFLYSSRSCHGKVSTI